MDMKEDIKTKIFEEILKGKRYKEISKKYNLSEGKISEIKKDFISENFEILRECYQIFQTSPKSLIQKLHQIKNADALFGKCQKNTF